MAEDRASSERRGFGERARDIFAHGWSRHYIQVFLYLLALTILTVLASYLPIGVAGHVFIALLIAAIKAGLVAAIFMHLLHEKVVIHRFMAFTVLFFLALVFLSVLALKNTVVGAQ
ncbi:MAG TPA: cytochrome C oxidase subunit IV family protein [Verrucomicrobiae bacterium]|nr:cytochrome C oxidase subunit IV family protein [Verrucomicrobiae bacterium]